MVVATGTSNPADSANQSPLSEQAKAITFMLEAELSSQVSLFDAQTGEEYAIETKDRPPLLRGELTLEAVRAYASLKRPLILLLSEASYRAVLPIKEAGVTRIIALTTLTRFARDAQATNLEMQRLEKWCALLLDKVSSGPDRSRNSSESRPREGQASNVLAAFDVLLRNTRLHGESSRFQRHALKAIAEVIGSEMAICVIENTSVIHAAHGCDSLSPWECRQLATLLAERTEWDRTGMLIDNAVNQGDIAMNFPQIGGLIAMKIPADGAVGYVIALNKIASTDRQEFETIMRSKANAIRRAPLDAFHRGDAALLASFSTLIAAQVRTAHRHRDLKDLVVGLTRSLTAAIDAKDSYTAGHSERVARMSVELGRELGLPEEQLNDIYLAGLLHDIGKIGIRDEVLGKNGKLTDEERLHINEHVVIGHRILSGLTGVEHLLGGVLYHHEQYDGSGYPEGLVGEKIPRLARIIAVADSFDAMSSDRPYRKGKPLEEVEAVLRKGSNQQWDPVIVDAFLRCKERVSDIRQRGIGDSLRDALIGVMRQDPIKEDVSLNFAMKKKS